MIYYLNKQREGAEVWEVILLFILIGIFLTTLYFGTTGLIQVFTGNIEALIYTIPCILINLVLIFVIITNIIIKHYNKKDKKENVITDIIE